MLFGSVLMIAAMGAFALGTFGAVSGAHRRPCAFGGVGRHRSPASRRWWRARWTRDIGIANGISQRGAVGRHRLLGLGIFDNYTGKATWKPGQNDTIIGYFQQGRKQKPRRGISSLLPAESVRATDSISRYKGEWQKVLTNRTFLNVNVGNFSLDWPMVVAVDPHRRRRSCSAPPRRWPAPAGTPSRPTARSRR